MTHDAAEEVMRAMERALDGTCAAHGLTDIEAAQFKFVALIYMLGTVAQRAGLGKAYVAERVGEMLPRAMDASEGDQRIDFHRGGVPSRPAHRLPPRRGAVVTRCRTCGGSSFIHAVDNHGEVYRGCATCRVAPAVGTAPAEDLRTRAIAAERMHEDAQAHLGDVLEVLRSIAHAVGAGPGLGGQSVDGQERQTWQDALARVRALVAEVERLRAELADCRAQVAAEARSHRATRLDLAAARKEQGR